MPANASWNLSVFTWDIFCWACILIYMDDKNLSVSVAESGRLSGDL